ncbi:right-handed parallel beta-helix repeat-containing protein [Cerasicoccus arenae]|uniref:Right handed beta helix domain-containing protein n=1 Tax=Cerasicoccus arenae TaxID=424488 RepID=A0A8J3GCG1_9BACT|nr:right-handed parallel beta-helix repeat-containing protein [Cerasicoccus arenae]MBK1859317.1 right-handed parallel beta-helix repeat-containing protein [Cerasicoccus arenae]GHB93969.1 hypothetical protein GCM10007047_06980 [Cerasicoccus arenae]
MLPRFIRYCFFILVFSALQATEIPEEWDVIIEVNSQDPTANDRNPATPFRTINAAVINAMGFTRAEKTARVLIHPGVYRESISVGGSGSIKLEASEPGKTILNGCDIVNGWKIGEHSVFELSRKFNPHSHPMVFVEGARLLEVDSISQVQAGKVFFGPDMIYLLPPIGGVVRDGTVEIGRQGSAISGESGLLFIESLAIERGYQTGISASASDSLIINNVSVEYCQDTGVDIRKTPNVRLRRMLVDRCGNLGLSVSGVKELGITGCEANLNGWAGENGGGAKFFNCENIKVWSFRLVENHGYGLSLIKNSGAQTLSKLTAIQNELGISSVDSSGKLTITESEIAFNENDGVFLSTSRANLIGNVLYGNGKSQLSIDEDVGRLGRVGSAGEPIDSELSLRLNMFVALKNDQLIDVRNGQLQAAQNLYDAPDKNAFMVNGKKLNFAQWQETTRTDLNSYSGDSMLLDPKNYNFSPTPKSPWYQMKSWPVRELN